MSTPSDTIRSAAGFIAQQPVEHARLSMMSSCDAKRSSIGIPRTETFCNRRSLVLRYAVTIRDYFNDGAISVLFFQPLAQGVEILVSRVENGPAPLHRLKATLQVEKITSEGERIVVLDQDVDLYSGGSMPLPPYIGRDSDSEDATRYQTVFAQAPGALAAPTAGLHFTPEILSEIPHTFVTLHVGTGTFLPVRSENIPEHRMHAEHFSISPSAAAGSTTPGESQLLARR